VPNAENVLAHRWKPGCPSPNPQGRRSDKSLVDHVLQETRDGAELGDILLNLARHAKRESDRIEAANALLDRCFGKIAPADRDSPFGTLTHGASEIRFAASFGPPRRAPGVESTDDTIEVAANHIDGDDAQPPESPVADPAETPETPVE
jgi:hypothetical protein